MNNWDCHQHCWKLDSCFVPHCMDSG